MTLTTKTTLGGLAVVLVIGYALGGRAGAGAVAGYLAGATAAGAALALQRRVVRARPELLAAGVLASFLIKACALLAATLAVAYVPALARPFDAVAFLFGFGGAALLVLLPATLDTLRALDGARSAERVGEARPS
jgi:hypothetical protein